jgi:hypothetical protein
LEPFESGNNPSSVHSFSFPSLKKQRDDELELDAQMMELLYPFGRDDEPKLDPKFMEALNSVQ